MADIGASVLAKLKNKVPESGRNFRGKLVQRQIILRLC